MTFNDPKSSGDYLAAWLAGHDKPSAADVAPCWRAFKGLV
jgi:hypothetical protein